MQFSLVKRDLKIEIFKTHGNFSVSSYSQNRIKISEINMVDVNLIGIGVIKVSY